MFNNFIIKKTFLR